MFRSTRYADTVVYHKGYAIYRNEYGETRVEDKNGYTIDLVFWDKGDAIQWINEVAL